MSTAELNKIKLNLIAWINQLSDMEVISFLDGLRNSKSEAEVWDDLSEEQKKIVLSGIKDAQNGKLMASKVFWEKLKNAR